MFKLIKRKENKKEIFKYSSFCIVRQHALGLQ